MLEDRNKIDDLNYLIVKVSFSHDGFQKYLDTLRLRNPNHVKVPCWRSVIISTAKLKHLKLFLHLKYNI